jgi:hypothetical protein
MASSSNIRIDRVDLAPLKICRPLRRKIQGSTEWHGLTRPGRWRNCPCYAICPGQPEGRMLNRKFRPPPDPRVYNFVNGWHPSIGKPRSYCHPFCSSKTTHAGTRGQPLPHRRRARLCAAHPTQSLHTVCRMFLRARWACVAVSTAWIWSCSPSLSHC